MSDIDEDPFSHFLSPVLDDEDPFDDSSYTAGITSYESASDSKTAHFRARLEERWNNYIAHDLLRHPPTDDRPRSSTPPEEDQLPDLYTDDLYDNASSSPNMEFSCFSDFSSSPPEFPSMLQPDEFDGWEADRRRDNSSSKDLEIWTAPLKRPRLRSSRTLSGKKHSWREPSGDLWTLREEDEDEMALVEQEQPRRRKRSKTVRWLEEVQVVEYER